MKNRFGDVHTIVATIVLLLTAGWHLLPGVTVLALSPRDGRAPVVHQGAAPIDQRIVGRGTAPENEGLDESPELADLDIPLLPREPAVRYRDPAESQSQGWYVFAASVVVLQTLLVGWLLVEHRQRRRAEVEVGARLQDAHTHLLTITHLDRRAAVGDVTAAITHELNQPLEAILHNAEAGEMMLESGRMSDGEMRQIFADIRRIDLRAAEILKRLRGLLRKKEFEAVPVDIHQVINDTAALVMPLADSKGVRIAIDVAVQGVPIVGDPVHLQQVLINVVLNAIEAMSETPSARRQLTIKGSLNGQGDVEVAVQDCGNGIRAEKVSQIFDPFYTTKGKGMGIGLSISRTIIEAHGGRMAARNNGDEGATIWFTLPPCVTNVAPQAGGQVVSLAAVVRPSANGLAMPAMLESVPTHARRASA